MPGAHAANAGRIGVLYLVSTLRRAGPTAQLLNIVRHLDGDRFDPLVVTLSPEPADSMIRAFEEAGIRVHSLAMSRLRGALHRGWQRDLVRLVPDGAGQRAVVHSQGIRGDVIAARQLRGLPRVATARNWPFDDYPLKFGPVLGRWMAWQHLRAFRRHPNVVACSSTLAERLRARGVAAGVIRNGVDTSRFRPAGAEERVRLRAGLGLPAQGCVGLSVGALSPRKDPVTLVRAFRAVDDRSRSLVFLGGGPLEAACREAAAGDERVRFAGEVDDVAPWMRAADFLVSASLSEGLPNAVLEALACGLWAVLSEIGPHRELLDLVPVAGEAFAPGDEGALAAAIGRAPRLAPEAAVATAAQRAALLGAQAMSRAYQALYLRLAATGAGA